MDERTLSFINLHAVLGCLTELCRLDREAQQLIAGKNISLGFAVKNGPEATLQFKDGACTFREGCSGCDIRLPFSGPRKFNGLMDGSTTPIPSKGFTKIGFLLKTFTKLTDRLSMYLQPEPGQLEDEGFFNISTTMMFYVILEAVAQIGNYDPVGRQSASYIVDGDAKLEICGGPVGFIEARDHRLTARHEAPKRCMSYMQFNDMTTARQLFDGKINAVAAVGLGKVKVGGMISQVDNINRILDRVALYLA
ncbi:MAG: hypothetical protein IIY40_03545 [Firmicutes bacterium]|nr:hypothetical protein [Bacillota bacterium]